MPKAGEEATAREQLIRKCVDVRMFGALVPITKEEGGEGSSVQLTGAVQFNPGQSLHGIEVVEIAGTGGFSSTEKARQRTFRREFIVPYALIGFYGVINEHLAQENRTDRKRCSVVNGIIVERNDVAAFLVLKPFTIRVCHCALTFKTKCSVATSLTA